MLALTDHATEAIEGILRAPAIPDGAGVRITSAPEAEAAPEPSALSITVAAAPAESDQVIGEEGARVFVDEPVAGYLDDKLLDVRVNEEQVSFLLSDQAQ